MCMLTNLADLLMGVGSYADDYCLLCQWMLLNVQGKCLAAQHQWSLNLQMQLYLLLTGAST